MYAFHPFLLRIDVDDRKLLAFAFTVVSPNRSFLRFRMDDANALGEVRDGLF